MSEPTQKIIENMIVIDRCLNSMFQATAPFHELAEHLRDMNVDASSADIFSIGYAPQYAAVCAIKPITDAVVFENGEEDVVVQSGYYDADADSFDKDFNFEEPYIYGFFAMTLLTNVIELNNLLTEIGVEEFSEEVYIELRKVIALTTIHRQIAEGELSLSAKQVLLTAAYFARKNLNDLAESLDDE